MNWATRRGASPGRGRPPPSSGRLPPLPPPNPSSFPSFSSSTLSPLAPPFTVDRPLPAVKSSISVPSSPPAVAAVTASERIYGSSETKPAFHRSRTVGASAAAMAPYVAPSRDSMWCSFSSTETSTSTPLNCGFRSIEAAPYYPYYSTVSNSLEDPVRLQNFKGYGGWNEAFDFEEGIPVRDSMTNSWIDPSPSCDTAESFSIYDDSFGSWHGPHNNSSTVGHVQSESIDWLDDRLLGNSTILVDSPCSKALGATVLTNKGTSYFQSSSTTAVKEFEPVDTNSYDRYISQLISCSRDSMVHYPATSYLRQGYEPLNVRNKSLVDSIAMQDCNFVTKHITPHENHDDFAGHIVIKQSDHSIYPNTENKNGYIKPGGSSNAVQKKTEAAVSSLVKGLSLENGSTLGRSISFLQDADYDLKIANSCEVYVSEKNAPKLDDSFQTSLELRDQLNVAVDSPCWKGASDSRWHPFGPPETVEPSIVTLTSGFDDIIHWQKPIVTHQELEHCDTSVFNAKFMDLSPIINLSCIDQKLQDCSRQVSDPLKVEKAKGIERPDVCGEQNGASSIRQVTDDRLRQSSEAENINCESCSTSFGPLTAVENTDIGAAPIPVFLDNSSSLNTFATNGLMKLSCPAVIPCELKTSVSSDAVTNDQIIVRAMLSLSEVLLCNYCSEVKVLEECDLKLARQIIHNLEVLTGGRSPVVNESISTKSFDAGNSNKDKDMKSKNETKSALDQAKHDSLATKYFAAHHRESDLVAQDFSQSLQGDFIEQEKELLYRNLWIQTEASLCSLKHDVALVKLEMENLKHHLKAESHASSYSRLEDSIHPLQTPVMTSTYVSDEHVSHGEDEQHIGSNFRCSTIMESSTVETEAENFLRQEDFIVQEEVVDATFLDRLRILKGRYDKVDLFSAELSVNGLCEELGGLKKPVDFMEYGLNIANKSCDSLKMMDMHGEKLAALEPKTGNTLVLSEIEPTGIKASHVADGLAIQSCNPKSQAKFLPSSGSGHGSLSSEWEHVLKDEYI